MIGTYKLIFRYLIKPLWLEACRFVMVTAASHPCFVAVILFVFFYSNRLILIIKLITLFITDLVNVAYLLSLQVNSAITRPAFVTFEIFTSIHTGRAD